MNDSMKNAFVELARMFSDDYTYEGEYDETDVHKNPNYLYTVTRPLDKNFHDFFLEIEDTVVLGFLSLKSLLCNNTTYNEVLLARIGDLVNRMDHRKGEKALGVIIELKGEQCDRIVKSGCRISSTRIHKKYKTRRAEDTLCKALIKELGISIIIDYNEYSKLRFLYNKALKDPDLICNIYDENLGEIIERDYKIQHGTRPEDIDTKIWSTDTSKSHILIILSERK